MMDDPDSSLRHFTRGGQTLLHNFRMVKQIVDRVCVAGVMLMLICWLLFLVLSLPTYSRYVIGQLGKAHVQLLFEPHPTQIVLSPNNKPYRVLCEKFINSSLAQRTWDVLEDTVIHSAKQACIFGLFLMISATVWLIRRGAQQTQDKKIRGDELAEWTHVKKQLTREKKAGDLVLGKLPFPKGFETGHLLIHGTTGSGKSECIKSLLDQLRKRGDKVIIYDKSCDYTQLYYQKDNDVLLNPLDERAASWHMWDECRDPADFDTLAASLMPHPSGGTDPFWVNGARTIFAAGARKMAPLATRSMPALLRMLLNADLSVLEDFLNETEAQILVSEKIEKTAISIKSVLATYLKSLSYIKDTGSGFSIRRFIQQDFSNNPWLFISSDASRHETLKPLISMWLDIATNALMSLTPNPHRRIWIILDELPSLHKLPYLTDSFAESRKFGGCFVAGMQSIAQLRKIYGAQAAEEISGLCNTRLFFREPSFETANWVAHELGKLDSEEVKEGVSYSESAIRSGISINRQLQSKQIVSPSDLMQLNNLEAYVRLPGHYPITKLIFTYTPRKPIAPTIVPRPSELLTVGETLSLQAEANTANQTHVANDPKKTRGTSLKKKDEEELPWDI